ncbi:sensor of ECF-type sigma factor [Flavobacterium sp. DG1-102-2]|uniref:sensor of ECF-type sigma factor n=1 Tax=Flavobacterium sp. DG1-102-2 TaxID=3081663 RepID=UPI00294957E4|nr:sensor of ECF-type sigma factor [Flavobacterium sp. DG1-102-2]MDV6166958.1 sensor of ECF-type sigma factor [Flavobacterium sp. DG1-102-2]
MKIKFILSVFLLFTMLAFGQQDKRDQLKAIKSSRIAAALNLSATESQKFWPVYLQCEGKTSDIEEKMAVLKNKLSEKNIDALTQKEAVLYEAQLQSDEEEIFALRKKMITDLKVIIGPKKILKLKMAEDDFTKLLVKKIKGKKD